MGHKVVLFKRLITCQQTPSSFWVSVSVHGKGGSLLSGGKQRPWSGGGLTSRGTAAGEVAPMLSKLCAHASAGKKIKKAHDLICNTVWQHWGSDIQGPCLGAHIIRKIAYWGLS